MFVERFPDLGDRQRISVEGADYPLWSPDGTELFYRSDGATNQVWRVSVGIGETLDPGIPELLFEASTYMNEPAQRMYDISPEGDRFLIVANMSAVPTSAGQLTVVMNWTRELLERVPVP